MQKPIPFGLAMAYNLLFLELLHKNCGNGVSVHLKSVYAE
jgi:hypothetical protein